jgi:hypothetical protein
MMRVRSAVLLTMALSAASAGTAVADPVEGAWEADNGALVDIVPTGPGAFAASISRAGSYRCAPGVGAQPYVLRGSFPTYGGTRSYSNSSDCSSAGDGEAEYRLTREGLTLCSMPPGLGPPPPGTAGDCTEFRRPGAVQQNPCKAVWLHGDRLVEVKTDRVVRRRNRLRPAAYEVSMQGTSCAYARRVLKSVLGARDEQLALQSAGLSFVNVKQRRKGGLPGYEVEAGVGGLVLRYSRIGDDPKPNHRIYRAGQRLVFGRQAPLLFACTGAYAVRLAHGRPGAVTSGHCTGESTSRAVRWEPGSKRLLLGRIVDNRYPVPDVLSIRLSSEYKSAPQIERGDLAPLTVVGLVPTAAQVPGSRICFAGNTTGAETCGEIRNPKGNLICTSAKSRPGDSGGPVYRVERDGFVSAVGILAVAKKGKKAQPMCYQPIEEALRSVGATLRTGP